jgi:hypothetical protein
MVYAIGIVLALVVACFARLTGFDRDRVFYPLVAVVVAVLGFKSNLWWAVAGLAGHSVFDALHGFVVTNPGVPEWWPAFCLSFDVAAAGFLAWLLTRSKLAARAT